MFIRSLTLVTVGLVAISGTSLGQGKGKKGDDRSDAKPSVVVPATEVEIRIIREYYSRETVKPKPLPPGIAKNLARGKPLPPGIAKTRLPAALESRLPERPRYQWVITGNVVVLVDPVGLVVDVLKEIF